MNGRTNSNNSSTMTILGDGIPLDPPSSFLCEARNSKVDITWVDPKDKYATPEGEQMEDTDQLVSVWSYTKIVRKEGSQPTSPSDGVTVCTNTTRNQYQSTIFEDTGVTNGATYYYAAYAYNTAGTYSDGAFSDGITPIEWDPILANNSWEQIDSACTQGVAQSMWSVGDEKNITVLNETPTCVIIDFNHDDLADGSGKASITFGLKNLLNARPNIIFATTVYPLTTFATYFFNANDLSQPSYYQYMTTEIEPSLDATLLEVIKSVNKYADMTRYNVGETKSVKCFPFALAEVGHVSEYVRPPKNTQYSYFSTNENRIKRLNNGAGSVYNWTTRTVYTDSTTYDIYSYDTFDIDTNGNAKHVYGQSNDYGMSNVRFPKITGICFGFCVGSLAA